MKLYQYYNSKKENKVTSEEIFDITHKIATKLEEHNLPKETKGIAIIVNSEEKILKKSSFVIKQYFYKRFNYTSDNEFKNFNTILADKIIVNSLTKKNEFIDDFTFKFHDGEFNFSFFETSSKKYNVILVVSLDEFGDKLLESYYSNSLISFVDYTKEDEMRNFIRHVGVEKLIKIFGFKSEQPIRNRILHAFDKNNFTKCDIIDYSEVRLESDFINAVVKIAEYLGHGHYMGDMKEEVKNDIRNYYLSNKTNSDFCIVGLKLDNTVIFYTGKGPEKEKLIILS